MTTWASFFARPDKPEEPMIVFTPHQILYLGITRATSQDLEHNNSLESLFIDSIVERMKRVSFERPGRPFLSWSIRDRIPPEGPISHYRVPRSPFPDKPFLGITFFRSMSDRGGISNLLFPNPNLKQLPTAKMTRCLQQGKASCYLGLGNAVCIGFRMTSTGLEGTRRPANGQLNGIPLEAPFHR